MLYHLKLTAFYINAMLIKVMLCLVVSNSLAPMDCSLPSSSVHGIFSKQEYWSGLPFPSPGGLPNPGIEPRSPSLQADSLPSEPPEKPKNTRVSSLSLQGIFLTQESNWALLHCRKILYPLSYPGSPDQLYSNIN